ncbi:MBL fold metallo-hydrolase [Faecalibacter bovis]|uniref:3',5'-cyclic-nucleotide phosphodiesterase n=1 Tax=Faecalibacter bovis TaxID=2898187 RepID=A0ABX7XCU9_9FLAO|nr:3',5'-cyclic-nucleotide phosphodiesterase [Faecalibacter bovis]QTV05731.1 3',5'-cyclic-nucleotide phosphodiesterase [Faecalibacter bovis]
MKKYLIGALFFGHIIGYGQSLEIVPLGVYGGSDESNLSSYLVAETKTNQYISMDGGTIYSGIKKAIEKETFTTDISTVLKEYIKGYFISHGHLDHLGGMIINSPEDSKKPIYGTAEMIDVLKQNYFTNAAWANFGSEGEAPIINKYHYQKYKHLDTFSVEGTNLKAKIYELSHVNPWKSAAIKVATKTQSLIYFGDTGADRIEQTNHLEEVWKDIAPEIKSGKLKTIMLEVSFPSTQPDHLLFGHLTPKLFMEEMHKLAIYVGKKQMKGLNIIVTHIKPKGDNEKIIKKELNELNDLGLNFIYPQQGERIIIK